MIQWSDELEEELAVLLKDWLKSQGKTQADLKRSLQSESSRMPSLLLILKKEHSRNGIPGIATLLCEIEEIWNRGDKTIQENELSLKENNFDPFGQLDLLLEEIREDCDS